MYHINLTEYFDDLVKRSPNRTAVIEGDSSITAAVLRQRCLAMGKTISDHLQGNIRQIIAVYLPKSIDSIAVDIAIIYSGNAYMNLDLKQPAQRTINIFALIQPALIITRGALAEQLEHLPGCPPLLLLEDMARHGSLTLEDEQALLTKRDRIIDTDPLCIINTSGSTGTPKGVVLNHKSFIDFTESATAAGLLREEEVAASLSPLIFDIYSFELCMLMAKGCTLLLLPETLAAFPARMLELMVTHRVSFIFWVPTIMVNIANLNLLDQIPLPDLQMIWFAGEVFPTAKCNYWRGKLPWATFVNLYGPIEITLDCLYHVLQRELADDDPIPIGKPFRNTDIIILNDEDESVRQGEEGELCIRGTSLALGYYNNPDKTALVFTQNPLNKAYPEYIYRTGDMVCANEYGELVFKGRKDTLIKHLGYRIELAEIEHVLVNKLKIVKNCCAVYNSEEKRIILFYESEMQLEIKRLRASIGGILPKYMIPAVYIWLSAMPLNANGKIDRLKLKGMLKD